jgi:hypothetical protein
MATLRGIACSYFGQEAWGVRSGSPLSYRFRAERPASESIVLEQKGQAVERAIEVAVRAEERYSP